MKTKFLVLLGQVSLVAACGGHSDGGSDSPAPRGSKSPVNDNAIYHLSLAAANGEGLKLADAKGKAFVFTWNLAIDGISATSGQGPQDALQAALGGISVRGGSDLTFGLTLADSSGKVAATNVAADAAKDPVTQKFWNDSCASVSTDVVLRDHSRVDEAGSTLLLDVPLCDFANVLVAPTIAITPANPVITNFDVVFECIAGNYNGFSDINHLLYMSDPYQSQCFPGYTRPRAGAIVTTNFLKGKNGADLVLRAPEGSLLTPTTIGSGNDFIDAVPNRPAARRFEMVSSQLANGNFADFGFARSRDCYGLEVQALYKDDEAAAAGTDKEARLSWRRALNNQNNLAWIPDDQTAVPAAGLIHAAAQKTNRYWLVCKWENPKGAPLATVAPKAN